MISGATYREGLALTSDGAVYVVGIASTAVVPSTGQSKGARADDGMKVSLDGELYVRFV